MEFSILNKFAFDVQPVGVKFLARRPRWWIVSGKHGLVRNAQEGPARECLLCDKENHACDAGLYVLGQADAPEPYVSGEFGAGLKIFEEASFAGRLYHYIPTITRAWSTTSLFLR